MFLSFDFIRLLKPILIENPFDNNVRYAVLNWMTAHFDAYPNFAKTSGLYPYANEVCFFPMQGNFLSNEVT